MIAVGLMSGTSLDGIDAALVRLRPHGSGYRVDLLNFSTFPFDADLLAELRAALPPNRGSVEAVSALNVRIGEVLARAAVAIAGDMPVDFIASHGQTIYHDGDAHHTLQAGDAFVIRERAASTVCFDFRSADCAAGGQGAPLVPYVDALLFADAAEDRVAVNIGGIANLTVIPHGTGTRDVTAFDSGPGNMLVDAFVRERSDGAQLYDYNGEMGMRGNVSAPALEAMLGDDYFAMEPPKSTGRERFGAQFLRQHAHALDHLSTDDGCATLAALTARSLGAAITACVSGTARVLVSGGGARNRRIMHELQTALPQCAIETTAALGVNPDAKEAIAFAVLGYELLRGRQANVPRVTGARAPVLLGAIAPHDLEGLLAKVRAECRT